MSKAIHIWLGSVPAKTRDAQPASLTFEGEKYTATNKVTAEGDAEYESVGSDGRRTGNRVWRSKTGKVTRDAEYSPYDQAMEATKAAQSLVSKTAIQSSSRKPDSLFREASQACKKAADLWGKAATENPQFKTNYLAAQSKWNSEAVELGRRAVGDGGGLTDMDADEVMDKYGATFLAKVRNQGSAKAPDGKTIRKAGSRFTADASSVAAAEKAIATQQRLIDGCVRNGRNVPPILQQRLAFLKEELDKAKVQTADALSNIDKIKKEIEKLVKAHKDVRSIGGWSGKELKVELEDISNGRDDRAYITFEINDAETKYRISSTMNGMKDLVGKTFPIPGKG